ncbi:LuxR C-terminal-related transcriptional regulator [Paraburkholderia sp. MMS20-SJTN17]|uniref:LuxR C-terminal-related transcriptional regulator n=1 Tax=Paraburkholderia translucens TaxID=2886945 RepID=A0ABS8K6R3_9BURK|nr:LuxR C-terminal-related transcriptional regulator [Paraburkholderia sp. MMS20-SJTN17]MCC8400431.1 LuxR C-terminal-related transcriptional regulator [Paraburkholderia sp. MMS20-SJTN17]
MNTPADSFEREWIVSLIQTKMMPPRIPAGCVQRPELLRRLDERHPRHLTLVIAPAGFGKTTLLAAWSEAQARKKRPVAWLSLDEEDDDPQQLGAYLVAALSRASKEIAWQAQQLLDNDAHTPVRTVISVLLNGIAAYGRGVFLVLDDVDRLSAKPVLAIVSRLLRYAPDNLHVLLGARAEPALPLSELRSPEKLSRVTADDLRFSLDDAQAFFERTGNAPLNRNSVELLNLATEGWVAGLQLASLGLTRVEDVAALASHLAGSRFGIDRYLSDTVFAHLPPHMLTFLLYTSILERLTAALCDEVMGSEGGSGEKLDWLERHNVFIRPLDETQDWYRYHALLSDALRRRLVRQTPGQVPLLHRRASLWFARARLWPEAVRHALAAGDNDQAAQWAENCAMEMLQRGDPFMLPGWIGKLPQDVIAGRLRLRLAKAWSLAMSLETARASKEISAIADEFERRARDDQSLADEAARTEINAVRAVIACVSDDSEHALELGRAVEASKAPAQPWVRYYGQSAEIFGLMYRGQFSYISRVWRARVDQVGISRKPSSADMLRDAVYGIAALIHGELPDAKRVMEVAMRYSEEKLGEWSASTAAVAGCLASICYECNELPKARKLIEGRMTIALETSPLAALMRYLLTASRVLWRDGKKGPALAVLEDGRQVGIKRRWLRLKLACDAEAVRQLIADGNVVEARQIADELSASVPMMCEGRRGSAMETWASYCVLQARVLLAEHAADDAVGFLSRSLDDLVALGWRYAEAVVSLLLALAHEQNGASQKALRALENALRIGCAMGLINSFVDEGAPMRALLEHCRRMPSEISTRHAAYIDTLLSAFDEVNKMSSPLPNYADSKMAPGTLSARELQILGYVARGMSNKEIGRSLKLAPETVKWHMKNVFEKLNVNSRFEAVQSAFGIQPGGD